MCPHRVLEVFSRRRCLLTERLDPVFPVAHVDARCSRCCIVAIHSQASHDLLRKTAADPTRTCVHPPFMAVGTLHYHVPYTALRTLLITLFSGRRIRRHRPADISFARSVRCFACCVILLSLFYVSFSRLHSSLGPASVEPFFSISPCSSRFAKVSALLKNNTHAHTHTHTRHHRTRIGIKNRQCSA